MENQFNKRREELQEKPVGWQEPLGENPESLSALGKALDLLDDDKKRQFEELCSSHKDLRNLLEGVFDPTISTDDVLERIGTINASEFNKGHEGSASSGMIILSGEGQRQIVLKWSKKGAFQKPSISVSS